VNAAFLAIELLLLHRKFHFDLIEVPNWEGIGAFSVICPQLPIAIRHHTSTEDSGTSQQRQPTLRTRSVITLENFAQSRARLHIVHSAYMATKLSTQYANYQIKHIRHLFTPTPLKSTEPAAKPRSGEGVILSVGGLSPRKGIDTLLLAAKEFLEKLPGWELRLVGIDRKKQYKQIVQSRFSPELAQRVVFEGFVEESNLHKHYRECDIYVTASLYESFGLTCLEAMWHSKPVVAARAGALPERVDDGRNGLLFEPMNATQLADQLCKLAFDPAMRQRMGAAGHAMATTYCDNKIACAGYRDAADSLLAAS
jgi:hypothetical protein